MAWVADVARLALGLVLSASAAAKLTSGFQPAFVLPRWLFHVSTGLEIAIVLALVTGRLRWASGAALALATGGILGAIVRPVGPCGCVGSLVSMGRREAVVLSGAIGLLALLLLRQIPHLRRRVSGAR